MWLLFCGLQKGTTYGTDRSLHSQSLPEFKAAPASAWHLADTDSMSLLVPVV